MNNNWLNSLTIDYIGVVKMMTIEVNSFRKKESGEYETASLRTPYRLVALMLNRIFSRVDGIFYNIGWIPLMYHVTMEGIVFNWVDIIANSLSPCITPAWEGLHRRNSEFYTGSFMIEFILFLHPFEKLNCSWKEGKAPIYATYHILWAQKYHNFLQAYLRGVLNDTLPINFP